MRNGHVKPIDLFLFVVVDERRRGNAKEDNYHPWFDYECHSGVTFQGRCHFRIKKLREVSRIFLVIRAFVSEEFYSVCLLVSSI